MRMIVENRKDKQRKDIPPNLPEILEGTAQALRDNGCSETLVRAALLSLCGIEIRELNMSALCIW